MHKKRETIAGWLFLAPALIIFAILVVFPVIMSLCLSFTEWNFLSGLEGIKWKGLANFERLFTRDRKFMMALGNTVFYAFTTAPVSIVIGLLFAFMLNDKVYLRKLNRVFFFIPYICSMVALAAVFRFLFRVDGPINAILNRVLGIEPVPWLNKTAYNRIPVVCVMIYAAVGYTLIVYMAALQSVPRELYEAATVDGANKWQQFANITIPQLRPTTFFASIMMIISCFKIFDVVAIMTEGGPGRSTKMLVTYIFELSFGGEGIATSAQYGVASAVSMVLLAIVLLVTFVQFRGEKKWVNYM